MTQAIVLAALAGLANPDGFVDASLGAITDACGLSRSTVKRALAALVEGEHLEIVTHGGGGRMSTIYRISGLSTAGPETVQETVQETVHVSDFDPLCGGLTAPTPLKGGGGGGGSLATSRNEPVQTSPSSDDDWPESKITEHPGHSRLPPIPQRADRSQCVNPRCGAPKLADETHCPWCGVIYPTRQLRMVQ